MRRLALLLALLAGAASVQADGFRTPNIVHQEKSLYRNILVVEGDGYRCMTFGRRHARQTCIRPAAPEQLVLPYTQALLAGLFSTPAPRRVLVIGLGGGVMPRALHALAPQAVVDTVELDPAVLDVAKRYFGFQDGGYSQAYVDDGRVFVRKQRRAAVHYDLILIDAFDKSYIPEHMLTREFLAEVKSLLNPGGTVAANTFADGALVRHEAATYQSVFGDTMTLDMDNGNRIILAGRDGLPDLSTMKHNAAPLREAMLPLNVSVDDLLRRIRPQARETRARVLTDQYAPANLLLRY